MQQQNIEKQEREPAEAQAQQNIEKEEDIQAQVQVQQTVVQPVEE